MHESIELQHPELPKDWFKEIEKYFNIRKDFNKRQIYDEVVLRHDRGEHVTPEEVAASLAPGLRDYRGTFARIVKLKDKAISQVNAPYEQFVGLEDEIKKRIDYLAQCKASITEALQDYTEKQKKADQSEPPIDPASASDLSTAELKHKINERGEVRKKVLTAAGRALVKKWKDGPNEVEIDLNDLKAKGCELLSQETIDRLAGEISELGWTLQEDFRAIRGKLNLPSREQPTNGS